MDLVFDIETDGLDATCIHCIVAIDEKDKVYSFFSDKIIEGVNFLQQADKLIGHNIIGFDIPIIKKLTGIDLYTPTKVIDTLVMSRLFKPSREGGHSLESWGYRLGFPKAKQPEWSTFTHQMLSYCIVDVKLNKKLLSALEKEAVGFSTESVLLEHEVTHILTEQKENGFLFNMKEATLLASKLSRLLKETVDEVHKTFKPKWVDDKEVTPKKKKDGNLSKQGLTNQEYSDILEGVRPFKPFMRQHLKEFNLGSRKQIGEYLQDFGWKPRELTPTGLPKIDESTLKDITHIYEAKLIADFLLYQKRIAQIQSWIEAVSKDERVHGSVISTGAITGRMAHRNPNMAQVPNTSSPYGSECRSCWIVDKGNKLVGVDASGLELRMLAHYMNDTGYTNEIINGDIHTTNQHLAKLKSRNQAKTFIYALCYGAGNAKLGSIVGGSARAGKQLREQFFDSNPSFKALTKRVERASSKGYLKGLDGRKIMLRHQHSALNTLLQGGGAIAMKKALVLLCQDIYTCGKEFREGVKIVANIHDEWQIEVPEQNAEKVGKLAVLCIERAGKFFNMRCPLTGEYKIGDNWNETH
tara:strand:+ start:2564 stop:4309 length:1746 start_codon:yes stop_codon:yes gene_type:complete